jgi:hypothetical protein
METSLANLNLIREPASELSGWLSIVNSLDYYDITESKCRGCELYIPQDFEAGKYIAGKLCNDESCTFELNNFRLE